VAWHIYFYGTSHGDHYGSSDASTLMSYYVSDIICLSKIGYDNPISMYIQVDTNTNTIYFIYVHFEILFSFEMLYVRLGRVKASLASPHL
jgi:hypothetical protein